MKASELRHKSDLGVRGIEIIAKNELVAFFRSKGLLLSQLLQPILYVVFIVIGLNSAISKVNYDNIITSYTEYAITGIIGLLIIGQMTQVIYRVTIDKKYGLLSLKLCSGVKPIYYILGMSVYSLLGLLVQEFIIYLVSSMFGVAIPSYNYFLVILLSIVSLFFWNGIAILITMFINDYRRRDIVIRFFLTPLGFTAPVFYIFDSSPMVIKWFALINPLTYQLDIMRKVYFGIAELKDIAILVIATLISLVVTSLVIPKINLILLER